MNSNLCHLVTFAWHNWNIIYYYEVFVQIRIRIFCRCVYAIFKLDKLYQLSQVCDLHITHIVQFCISLRGNWYGEKYHASIMIACFHFICKYWLSCLSFEFSDIFSVWFYGDLHDYVSCNRTGSLLNPYFKSYFSWITQFYFIFHSKKYTNIGKVVAELYVCKRM